MGNTILAHALFACNQTEVDLHSLFSENGHAHAIREINKSVLTADHLIESPDPNRQCILTVECTGWGEVIRIKMSYSKWYEDTPRLDNYSKFFPPARYTIDSNNLWKEFYQNYRSDTWPECNCVSDIINLPTYIQKEINTVFQQPTTSLNTEQDFLEWLSRCYYDMFTANKPDHFPIARKINLLDYLNGDSLVLQQTCEGVLGWTWDHKKSNQFHLLHSYS